VNRDRRNDQHVSDTLDFLSFLFICIIVHIHRARANSLLIVFLPQRSVSIGRPRRRQRHPWMIPVQGRGGGDHLDAMDSLSVRGRMSSFDECPFLYRLVVYVDTSCSIHQRLEAVG
jgi:hypothetical protein